MPQPGTLFWNRNKIATYLRFVTKLGRREQVGKMSCGGQRRAAEGATRYAAKKGVAMPSINELTRIEPVHLARLEAQGIFTTGLLLERSETPTRRQTLADQTDASLADVNEWRDEALLLNLAFFGRQEHQLLAVAGYPGIRALAESDWEDFLAAVTRATLLLGRVAPDPLSLRSWWEQGRVLVDA
jgi:hypothetical protein